jgi:integrase
MYSAELDRNKWLWTLPPDRSKNGRARVTPIIGLAREIIEARLKAAGSGPLFATERGAALDSNLVASILVKHRKKNPVQQFTSHDLRRTVATQLVELGFPYDLVAAVLGHETGNKDVRTLLRHYVRSDLLERKTTALTVWDKLLRDAIWPTADASNVVSLISAAV